MNMTEMPGAGSRSLPGTCDLIVVHGEVPLDEKLLVAGIEDSRIDVPAGEGLNSPRDSQKLTVMNSARSPSVRQSSQAPQLPGVPW